MKIENQNFSFRKNFIPLQNRRVVLVARVVISIGQIASKAAIQARRQKSGDFGQASRLGLRKKYSIHVFGDKRLLKNLSGPASKKEEKRIAPHCCTALQSRLQIRILFKIIIRSFVEQNSVGSLFLTLCDDRLSKTQQIIFKIHVLENVINNVCFFDSQNMRCHYTNGSFPNVKKLFIDKVTFCVIKAMQILEETKCNTIVARDCSLSGG